MTPTRRTALTYLGAACATPLLGRAQTQPAWPTKPIRLVIPLAAGSAVDNAARVVMQKMGESLGQSFVMENIAGSSGLIGAERVAKAAPDGYTLGIGFNGPIAFSPFMVRKMPYDPAKDLLPVVLTTSQANVFAVQAGNPAKTFPEFVAWARAQGGKVSYGSVGNGSSSHLSMELLKSTAGFEAVHVPYSGSPPAANSLAAGDTQALIAVASALNPLVQAGKVKFLAVTSQARMESLKELPTIAESGYPGFEALAWNGLFAPAGTPAAVIEKINADVNEVMKDPAVREAFAKQGLVPGGGSAAQFKAFIDAEATKWGAIIRKAGITTE